MTVRVCLKYVMCVMYVSGMSETGFKLVNFVSPEIRGIAEKIRQSHINKNIKRYRS